ncbi:hypothetical protein AB3X71_10555, partial [Streptococcus pneumoniae]
ILLRDYALPERFGLLFIAFETSENRVDYPKLLDFIINYYDANTMCSFIIENANLAVSDLHFRKALKAYLTDHPKSIWKDKTRRKEVYAVNNDHLKILIKEVEKETANLLVRLIKRTGINL